MVFEASAITRLARLREDFDVDVIALDARASEAAQLVKAWPESLPRPELVLLAVNLHGYYTALETLLERVARLLDDELPTGPSWHQELLDQMRIQLPGLRPPVIPGECLPELNELRRFRHFFRNAYVLDLDAAKVRRQQQCLAAIHAPLRASLDAFRRYLEATLATLSGSG